jgi:hypothetical protein
MEKTKKTKLFEEIKKITQNGRSVDVITQSSGVCFISPPGEMLHPDAEPGDPGYGELSQCWVLLPEGGNWAREYSSLEELLQAEGDNILSLA